MSKQILPRVNVPPGQAETFRGLEGFNMTGHCRTPRHLRLLDDRRASFPSLVRAKTGPQTENEEKPSSSPRLRELPEIIACIFSEPSDRIQIAFIPGLSST